MESFCVGFLNRRIIGLFTPSLTLEGLKAVSAGDADLFIGVSFNSYFITKYQLFDVVSKYIFSDYSDTFDMAVRSDWPELVPILNKGIASLSQNEINAIVAKWIHLLQPVETIELTDEEQAWIVDHPKIILGIDATWDPLVRIAPDGALSGIDVDFLSLLNKRLGTDIQLKTGSWKDLVEKAKTHEIDGLAASAAGKPRQAHFLFSLPYVQLHKSVHVRAGSDLNVNGLQDLRGRKVAIQQGNIFVRNMLEPIGDIEIVEYPTEMEGHKGMLRGETDASIGTAAPSQTVRDTSRLYHR